MKFVIGLQLCCYAGRLNNVLAIMQHNHCELSLLVGICRIATTLTFSYNQLFGKAPIVA